MVIYSGSSIQNFDNSGEFGSGSGKTNTLLNLINEQHDIDKIYFYGEI